jgi:hypothetical protein
MSYVSTQGKTWLVFEYDVALCTYCDKDTRLRKVEHTKVDKLKPADNKRWGHAICLEAAKTTVYRRSLQ